MLLLLSPREGWADLFLRKGYSVFLVDQPRRGAAGATEEIVTDPGATHIRTYFVKEYVDLITAKIRQFFTEKL